MSEAKCEIVVIGAAGSTGQAVIHELSRRGKAVRALIHREAQRALFPALKDIRTVELSDPRALTAALSGAAVVYYIPPTFNADEEAFGANVIAAALAAGIGRLVYHSVLHAPTPAMIHHLRKSRVELALRESSLVWTIVQPAMYAQTPLAFLNAERTMLTTGFSIDRPFTPIDIADLAEAIANIVCENGHAYATYELAGSETLTIREMAAVIGQATKIPVEARSVGPGLITSQAIDRGFGPAAAAELGLMMRHYDDHGLVGNANVLAMILRRDPSRFAAAMARSLAI